MTADLVITGGRLFTAEPDRPFVTAVSCHRGLISGFDDEALSSIGAETTVIDLDGALATPGFIDAHVHPASSGLDKLRCHFDDCHDADSAVARVAEYARDHPDLEWVIGAGWLQSWFPRGCPPKELLDSVVPDRPALMTNSDGHGAWANSKALERAAIDASTPDPADGRIERRVDGEPQGTLHEGAIELVESRAPVDTIDDFVAGLIRGQEELLRHGITGWQDAIVDEPIHEAYLRVCAEGRLVGRVVGAMWWDRHREMEQIDELVARRERSAPGFRPTAVKLMLDGVAENFTASMLAPYLDREGEETRSSGIDFIDRETLMAIVPTLDRLGFQCHFHAIGDAAVRNALDAVEQALARNGASDNRHHIAHIQVIHPDDIPRFPQLGVIANAQPFWACNDEYQTLLTRPFLGEERYRWQYPFGSLLAAGSRLGMGSDWGVSTCSVMREIDVAVTRVGPTGGEPLTSTESLDPMDALRSFTIGSAFVNHAEQGSGSLAMGKLADFAVLDRDPLLEGAFKNTKVTKTIVGGEIVHEES